MKILSTTILGHEIRNKYFRPDLFLSIGIKKIINIKILFFFIQYPQCINFSSHCPKEQNVPTSSIYLTTPQWARRLRLSRFPVDPSLCSQCCYSTIIPFPRHAKLQMFLLYLAEAPAAKKWVSALGTRGRRIPPIGVS